jgi:hypothetical protein
MYGPYTSSLQHSCWLNETNTLVSEIHRPAFGPRSLLTDKLKTMQWWEEDRGDDGFYTVTGLRRPRISSDGMAKSVEGLRFAIGCRATGVPVKAPTIVTDGASVASTKDGCHAMVYNPANDGAPVALAMHQRRRRCLRSHAGGAGSAPRRFIGPPRFRLTVRARNLRR